MLINSGSMRSRTLSPQKPRRMSPSKKAQWRFFFSGHQTLKILISWGQGSNAKDWLMTTL